MMGYLVQFTELITYIAGERSGIMWKVVVPCAHKPYFLCQVTLGIWLVPNSNLIML